MGSAPKTKVAARKPAGWKTDEFLADKRRFDGFSVVRKAIVEHSHGRWGVAGEMPCPIDGCGGTVRYEAHSNGHVWAGCSNAATGCVSWME